MKGTHKQLAIARNHAKTAVWITGIVLACYILVLLIIYPAAIGVKFISGILQVIHNFFAVLLAAPLELLTGWYGKSFLMRLLVIALQTAIIAGLPVSLYIFCYFHVECQHLLHPERLRGTGLVLSQQTISEADAQLEQLQQACPDEDLFAGDHYVRVQELAASESSRRDYIVRWDENDLHKIQAPPYQYLTLGLHYGVPKILCLDNTGSETAPEYIERTIPLPPRQPLVIYRDDQKVIRFAITWLGGK